MFSILLQLKRRILKLFKVRSEARRVEPPSRASLLLRPIILGLTAVIIGVFYPGEDLYDPLDMPRKGEVSLKDIISPFQVTVFKTEQELADEQDVVRLSTPPVIDVDTTIIQSAFASLKALFDTVDSVRLATDTLEPQQIERQVAAVSSRFALLPESAIRQSFAIDSLDLVHERLRKIYTEEIYNPGVLPSVNSLSDERARSVLVRRGDRESIHSRQRLLHIATANARLLTALNRLADRDAIDVEYYYLIGRTFIQPNLRVNVAEHTRRLARELDAISGVKEVVSAGDIIVRNGNRVSERQAHILSEMARILRIQASGEGIIVSLLPVLIRIALVLICFLALYLFLRAFRQDVFNSNPKLVALLMVFTAQLFLVHLVAVRWELSIYLFPIAILPIMVTILFDAEVGLLSTLVLALLLGLINRFSFPVTLMTISVGTVACFAAQQVRRRSHFFRIMLAVAVTMVLFIFLVEMMKLTTTDELPTEIGYGLLNAVLSAFLTIGLLPLFESLFGITTDITLLELSDLNHPLLKRLAIEAPGTYHHSILVGNLTEAGAKAIGANALLARVGAYYHDIGKIEIPEYYVENQLSVKSRHDMLTPSMSSLVLSSHVKKGRKLGEEASIPDDVLNFIEEHHGTLVQTYFYDRAVKQSSGEVDINKFRYPGPKPQTRETGIAMLSDAVEAASRTLEDPKPARIENLIQRIINDRFESGELSECPLTLRDLARIKEAFSKVLIGVFHRRIAYPGKIGGQEAE
ncbi:MAG: HD family phosphohydrolase [Candidatus Zixiibacteriota bacterium]